MSLQRRKGLWQVRGWKLTDKQIKALLDRGLLVLKQDARSSGRPAKEFVQRFFTRAEAA